MKLSVIIPTVNESEHIANLLGKLEAMESHQLREVIVVDGGSTDNTIDIAKRFGVKVLNSPQKGRAPQMNLGAQAASGDILYFVHGDTLPPDTFIRSIEKALKQDFPIGCFRYQFNSPKKILRINAFFTRFKMLWCRGGDQSLFIKKEVFEKMGGFREDYIIMEDFEFIVRAQKEYPFKIIPENMTVSARKYEENSYLRVQIANLIVFNMFRFGGSQKAMVKMYRRLLKSVKN
jgi:rSAM/selenodomain-associated transferase 2